MPAFPNRYTMYFHRGETSYEFSNLVSWDDEEGTFEDITNEIGMHPGHNLQTLEVQECLWVFLVAWSKSLP